MGDASPNPEPQVWPPIDQEELRYLDEVSLMLSGWPGYRNRPGRSGLDYLDSEFELAHMEGVFFRALITGRLWTDSRAYLVLMGCVAGFCLLLFSFPVVEFLRGGYVHPGAWCPSFMPGLLGTLLLWNLARNLVRGLRE